MTDFNYKDYSLEHLENWMYDALSCDKVSPHEIYSVIRKVVQENYNHHKEQMQRSFGLLELLSGHRPVNLNDDCMPPWGHSDLEYLSKHKEPVSCDKDDASPECQGAWNDFWGDVNNNPEDKKRWVLPVNIDGLTGDCYVNFPDDLLEAANLKEGDLVKWVDNNDGSYLLRKV